MCFKIKGSKDSRIIRIQLLQKFVVLLGFSILFSGCVTRNANPLTRAVWKGDISKIKTLVAEGADVNEVDALRLNIRLTALNDATDMENLEVVKTLIELGADPNIYSYVYTETKGLGYYRLDYIVCTPLMLAALQNNLEITEVLLKAGANPNARSAKDTAMFTFESRLKDCDSLWLSEIKGSPKVAELLLKNGADPNTSVNNLPLAYTAAFHDRVLFVHTLLDYGYKFEVIPEYPHLVSTLAHLIADYIVTTKPEAAFELYEVAAEYYPEGVKRLKAMATSETIDTTLTIAFAQAVAGAGGNVIIFTPSGISREYSKVKYFNAKAEQAEAGYALCLKILDHQKTHPDKSLAECVQYIGRLSQLPRQ